ncbi:hypothetical protein RhiirC2_796463 [Rhizophagus irregularis]|uniref:Homeodomain-like protein n=1 Tax=Rhizophagus irregularis TaxID=588596 RepID=A0A2N1M9Q4_9GLOM|nr:hypothetical protein RhiirC2_796463 [Rhizophagus irregularis]
MARAFGNDLKWRIVFLRYDGYSRKRIAELLYISKGTVDKIWQRYMRWGTVVDSWQKSSGRRKILNRNEMKILQDLVKEKVD